MNKYFKGIVLATAFLIPIIIFLFLKLLGENRFDIPVYYQNEVTVFEGCNESVNAPYQINSISNNILPGVFLFFEPTEEFNIAEIKNIKLRLESAVNQVNYSVKTSDSSSLKYDYIDYLDQDELNQWMHCKFITDTLNQFILVDSKARIRGYYDSDREEIDRLIVELKILLENEQSAE